MKEKRIQSEVTLTTNIKYQINILFTERCAPNDT